MTRGRLLVFLGAAPGVGKTYAMLEEAHRLLGRGEDVVSAVVLDHGRSATAALTAGIETVPLRVVEHRGIRLEEVDLDAVLARRPRVALVDELAHTNAPGSRNGKRWEDIDALLDAGIDVLSTVNIQHIASLNDVVERITGIPQRETIPDRVLRRADRIELVDLAPQALRDRLTAGQVYPAARIDAALSNYFRLGNLTALRELALLWLADEVDSALQRYRAEQGIATAWEARERVVVALTGGAEGETLLRRGARIAARSGGGELLAVHVASEDGLAAPNPAALAAQRVLVEQLGGTFHQVVGEDIPAALIEFARAVSATQLVIGVSRRSRLLALATAPGTSSRVIRSSGDIDVHIVTHSAAGQRSSLVPRGRGALSAKRRALGFALAVVGGPVLTLLLTATRSTDSLTAEALAYQLLVILVALVGGAWPAAFAAVLSGLTLDFLFAEPFLTFTIDRPSHLIALLLYLVSALLVSVVVDRAARLTRAARRSASESEVLSTIAGGVLGGEDAVEALLERTREAFRMASVRLIADGRFMEEHGDADATGERTRVRVADRFELELVGRPLDASDRRILDVVATQLGVAIEQRTLTDAAKRLEPLEEVDRVRSALLAAVGHDLRRPLAVATAAVTSLRSSGDRLSAGDRTQLLEGAERSLDVLAHLVTDLLDVSRVQAGALAVSLESLDVADVLPAVLGDLDAGPDDVVLHVPEPLPPVRADPVLLQRVLVNLLSNAIRHSPDGVPPELAVSTFGQQLQIRVIDHGPGIDAVRRARMFEPFQHDSDTSDSGGIGLGLALSRGFAEGMGGTIEAEDTPGGGLTMVIGLPVDATVREPAEA
ncbi:ATP-binding protein [Amnibacterium setariae]|uniref:histidine kinase n=1 Tax=Amnibacterium setariae TaxID=2306585 RepID=A0A3A1U281_9MICO|nr:ATP-binding protein [Amnibacterium setariae]RIX30631.1 sensor histidine kinase KdpD [Amnibacterium setariae]